MHGWVIAIHRLGLTGVSGGAKLPKGSQELRGPNRNQIWEKQIKNHHCLKKTFAWYFRHAAPLQRQLGSKIKAKFRTLHRYKIIEGMIKMCATLGATEVTQTVIHFRRGSARRAVRLCVRCRMTSVRRSSTNYRNRWSWPEDCNALSTPSCTTLARRLM